MTQPPHFQSSLNQKVFAISLLATLATVAISLAWQADIFMRELQERSFAQASGFLDTIGPSVARASWQVNTQSIEFILDAVVEQPGIVYAAFTDDTMVAVAGDSHYGSDKPENCPLSMVRDYSNFSFQGMPLRKADLYACFDDSSFVGISFLSFAKAQVPLLACVLLVTALISISIHRMIVKPLQRLSQHLTHGEPVENFRRYQSNWNYRPDEMDKLIEELIKRTRLLQQERHIVDVSIPEVSDAIAQTDRDLLVTRCNQAMQIMATSQGEGSKVRLSDYFDEAILRQPGMHDDVAGPGGRRYELRTVSFGPDADGGFLYVIKDLTENHEMQQRAIHEGKMSSLGVLSSGVAHDFNNILAGILGSTELLLDELKNNKRACAQLETIAEYSQRGASLTNQLLSFARRKSQTRTVFPASVAIDNLLKIAQPLIGKSVLLTTEIRTQRQIDADAGLLDSSLMNLVINSMDAMTDKGSSRISITLSEQHRDHAVFVCFEVADNGRGIPRRILTRIREPFYTTKRRGQGTGLGMAMVSGFAEQSGGKLEIESEVGVGTKVRLLLPVASQQRLSGGTQSEMINSGSLDSEDSGTLLIIEDEASIREVAALMLGRCGYKVTSCGSIRELDERRLTSREFDLVLCDVMLDSCSALDILEKFRQEDNESPFALISGNFTADFMAKMQRHGDIPTLDKPFRKQELVEFVRKQLQMIHRMDA